MKAIGYIRVSTAGQVKDGISIDAQESKIKAWAELNDAEVVIFRDEGISGSRSDNRPGLKDALDLVNKGDALVVYSLSRLSRSTKETLEISEVLVKKEADLVSLSEKIDTTTASGKMIFRIFAVFSEFERDQTAERTKLTLAYMKAKGMKTGGEVPFGYRVQAGKLYRYRKEQQAIAMIVDLRGKGKSMRMICRRLELEGFKKKNGSRVWNPQTVKNILKYSSEKKIRKGTSDT